MEPDSFHGPEAPRSVVVVTIKLINIDAAKPEAKEFGESPYEFNASVFRLQGSSVDDMAILGGRGDLELTPTNGYYFVLHPGQTTELEIAYGIPASDGARNAVLNIGSEGSGDDKISVDLLATPAEEGDA